MVAGSDRHRFIAARTGRRAQLNRLGPLCVYAVLKRSATLGHESPASNCVAIIVLSAQVLGMGSAISMLAFPFQARLVDTKLHDTSVLDFGHVSRAPIWSTETNVRWFFT